LDIQSTSFTATMGSPARHKVDLTIARQSFTLAWILRALRHPELPRFAAV
jgi:hypothetical protein